MASRARYALGVGALVSAFASATACERVLGVDFDSAELAPSAACDSLVPPGAPQTAGAGDDIDFVVVIKAIDFGDREDDQGRALFSEKGYDVDGICSGLLPGPCHPAAWTGVSHVDGLRGQDNGVGRILFVQKEIVGVQVMSSEILNTGVADGNYAPFGVIRVTGYGGFTEDEHLVVDWFVPVPTRPTPDTGFAPRFDGSDEFPVVAAHEAGVADGGATDAAPEARVSRFRDENAYVARRTLVARFPKLLVPLARVYFEVEDAVVTGIPVRDAGSGLWTLTEGIFSARARLETVLVVVPEMAYTTSGIELCPNDPNFVLVKQMICSGADTLFDGPAGPNVECDGVAAGLSFESAPAVLGPPIELPASPPLCPDLPPEALECATAP